LPSVNVVLQRFECQTLKSIDPSNILLETNQRINVQDINNELTILQNQLEIEKKRGKTVNQQRKVSLIRHWWEAPIEELNLEQLEQLHLALLEVQKNVQSESKKAMGIFNNQDLEEQHVQEPLSMMVEQIDSTPSSSRKEETFEARSKYERKSLVLKNGRLLSYHRERQKSKMSMSSSSSQEGYNADKVEVASLLAWNCRGLGGPLIVPRLKEMIVYHTPDVVFLSEIKHCSLMWILCVEN
ncbi:hypothetical protein ACH5RR_001292, partial [Cinchona calisaya]